MSNFVWWVKIWQVPKDQTGTDGKDGKDDASVSAEAWMETSVVFDGHGLDMLDMPSTRSLESFIRKFAKDQADEGAPRKAEETEEVADHSLAVPYSKLYHLYSVDIEWDCQAAETAAEEAQTSCPRHNTSVERWWSIRVLSFAWATAFSPQRRCPPHCASELWFVSFAMWQAPEKLLQKELTDLQAALTQFILNLYSIYTQFILNLYSF